MSKKLFFIFWILFLVSVVSLGIVSAEITVPYDSAVRGRILSQETLAMSAVAILVSVGSIIIQLISHVHNLRIQQKIHKDLDEEFIKSKIRWSIGSAIALSVLILVIAAFAIKGIVTV